MRDLQVGPVVVDTVASAITSPSTWRARATTSSASTLGAPSTAAGRVEIESKEEARKRGQSSPDRAEALVMACMRIVPREHTEILGGTCAISAI
jgi:hypothetical protein